MQAKTTDFMSLMSSDVAKHTLCYTENGALGYASTGKALLDLNFAVSSYRNRSDKEIINDFLKAFAENPFTAMVWLFFCRDVRGGMGERRFFRVVMNYLCGMAQYNECTIPLLRMIPKYGRWDDMFSLINNACCEVKQTIFHIIADRLVCDLDAADKGEPVSLMAKWMPSDNASNKDNRHLARVIAAGLGCPIKYYRYVVTMLRKHIGVLETKLSANEWNEVDYSAVPSQANLLYRKAFLRHDKERREEYLEKLSKGEEKINASTLFPHDIVSKYGMPYQLRRPAVQDELEALWSALPDYVNGESSTLVVRDGSGSMLDRIGNTSVTAMNVSTALAIYFAERCSGPYKDKFITFSSRPQIVNLSNLKTLRDKLQTCYGYGDVSNTNIEAVFDLILRTAIDNHCKQEDLPGTVLIVSDMEFDGATTTRSCDYETLFDTIRKKFKHYGYEMPKLAFWNVCSRTNAIPVQENNNGVVLVSGFSPSVIKMVLSNEVDPYKALMGILNSERYAEIRQRLVGEYL